MQKKAGGKVSYFKLPSIDNTLFDLESLKGRRYMLSFFRFASCPFCNLRVHELVVRFWELGGDFTIVAVFDSSLENLQKHADKHRAPFPILADKENSAYNIYGIEHSVTGMIKGMIFRMPTLLKGMFLRGYIPRVIKGSLTTLPADFLVDETGIIQTAYYGKDEGDHLSFDKLKAFASARKEP